MATINLATIGASAAGVLDKAERDLNAATNKVTGVKSPDISQLMALQQATAQFKTLSEALQNVQKQVGDVISGAARNIG